MNKSKIKKEPGIEGGAGDKRKGVQIKEMVKPNKKIKSKLIPHCYNIYRPQNGDSVDDDDS